MFQILIDCSVENGRQIKFNQSAHQTGLRNPVTCLFIHLPIIIARSEEMRIFIAGFVNFKESFTIQNAACFNMSNSIRRIR